MSAEIFNPNPTVFAPGKTSRAHAYARGNSLWLNDGAVSEDGAEDESGAVDAIDADVIFGACVVRSKGKAENSLMSPSVQTSSARFRTLSTAA